MYIKKLVMHGFKSFPKKTEVPFTQGINVVLGPNGSGKSNVSDAICFVLGRLSIKSMRAAKAGNLIFLGTKTASPGKEASVEIVFDNSQKTFSLNQQEVTVKRIVRRNGQSIYKINNETKTRQEVISLLAQAGIDPNGFNIILQGEIQNFVRMQSEERRHVVEEVSGISIYEERKEKSLKELEKTEERLKEINSVLRERTAYLNNLEKERQQALKFRKLEAQVQSLKASILHNEFSKKRKQAQIINADIEAKARQAEILRKAISDIESGIKNLREKIDNINKSIQISTGMEQEALNTEIANIRAELAAMGVRLENTESKLQEIERQKQELVSSLKESEESLKHIKNEPVTTEKKKKEVAEKKKQLEFFEEKRKRFYTAKSEARSLKERISDKENLLQSYSSESDFLIKHIESLSIGLFDKKADKGKLFQLKSSLSEKRNSLSMLLKKEIEFEKNTSSNESEIENQKKMLDKISKMDICPVCSSRITPEHMKEIKAELLPRLEALKAEIISADNKLKDIYEKKEILGTDVQQLAEQISKTEADINIISQINEKKEQIKNIHEKSESLKKEISVLVKKRESTEKTVFELSNVEQRYETLRLEIQEISLRTKESVNSEVSFKERETERLKISLKQILRNEKDLQEELLSLRKIFQEKEKILSEKRQKEAQLSQKFKKLISERDSFHSGIRENESKALEKQHVLRVAEQEINELKITKARVDAEAENLGTEFSEFPSGIEIIPGSIEALGTKLTRTQETFSATGNVNLRSIEVYDAIKEEYDSIKEKAGIIVREKESILKIIHEIDVKKKKVFLQTLSQINELFSRNFSELSFKGQVYLEIDNKKEPFEPGSGVQIIVKTGHGKYFDVKSLSGGEQTLVALSLIFAIQEYKPYSFYLLDEIDAALDKRNSERLAGLLNKYMRRGQYIVITHNDEIISRATNLYGISMHDGISKIVSLKV